MAKSQPYKITKLSEVRPYEKNPRIIPQAAVNAVARSIQAFGFRQPIFVDGQGVILAGHTRYKAAQQLGLAEVPVVWQTDIDERISHVLGGKIDAQKLILDELRV